MMKIAIAPETSDLHRLAYSAIKAANVSDDERCSDILRYMKSLNLSVKDLCHSKAILPLASLRDHQSLKIRMEANVLFNSWLKTLYSGGRNSYTCNKARPLKLKKVDVVKVCSELKKEEDMKVYHDIAEETKGKTEFLGLQKNEDDRSRAHETGEVKQIDGCKSFPAKLVHAKKRLVKLSENPKHCPYLKSVRDDNTCKSIQTKFCLTQKKHVVVQVSSKSNKTEDQRSRAPETGVTKQILKKPNDCKSSAAMSIQAKKRSALPMKLPENPRFKAHGTGEIKQNLKKSRVCKSVLPTSRTLQMKKQTPLKDSQTPKYCSALKKNSTDMVELFELAKKSADVANAKGLLVAKVEASICVDTLSLLMDYPISSTDTGTRRIMVRLESLTKHKDRKICNSASALLHCWRQNISDQQH